MVRTNQQFFRSALWLLALVLSIASLHAEPPAASSELQPIEVEGEKTQSGAEGEIPFGGQRLEILPDQPGSLSRNLIRAPSVSFRKWGNDEAAQLLSLRGQDPSQTRLYLNGFPLGEGAGSGLDTRWLNPRWISHALILPNGDPMALLHESLGGAVDMRTAFGENRSTHPNDVGVLAGSFGTRGANGRLEQSGFGIGADVRKADDDFAYQDSAGTLWDASDDTSARRNNNAWWRGSVLPWYAGGWGPADVRAFWLGGWESRQLPGPAGATGFLQLREQFHLAAVNVEERRSGAFLRGYGRYRENQVTNAAVTRAAGLAGVPGKSREVAGGATGGFSRRWSTSGRLRALVGADRETLENEVTLVGGSTIRGKKDSIVSALAVEEEWGVDHALVVPIEWNSFNPFEGITGYEAQTAKRYVLVNPRWATSAQLFGFVGQHTMVGYFQKSPGLYDLYGDARGLLPNPSLVPERAIKAEIGWEIPLRVWGGHLSASATSSWSENFDLLARVSMGPTSTVAQNIGRSRILSEEVSALWTFESGWRWQWVAQALFTTNLSPIPYYNGQELPYRSKWRSGLDVEKQWNRFSVGYLWQWQSGFSADQMGARKVASFQEHSVRARYNHQDFGEWTLEMANIFDATTVGAEVLGQSLASSPTGLSGYPYPGRRAYVTWNYPW